MFIVCLSFTKCSMWYALASLRTILGHPRWRGQGTPKGSNLLGLGHYIPQDITSWAPHILQWSGGDHCCQLGGWSCCSPVETSSWSVLCCLKKRGTLVMWGIASESFGSTYTKNDYLWKRLLIPVPRVVGCVRDVSCSHGVMIGVMILWSRGTTLLIGA